MLQLLGLEPLVSVHFTKLHFLQFIFQKEQTFPVVFQIQNIITLSVLFQSTYASPAKIKAEQTELS